MEAPRDAAQARPSSHASIHDVARQARVSTGTVSNFFNRPQLVAEATRLRIQEAVAVVGYVPDSAARVMRGATSPVVGCILLDLANPFYAAVFRGIEDGLRSRGLLVLVGSSDVDGDRERDYLRLMRAQRVRGVILNPTPSVAGNLSEAWRMDLPVVLVDHPQNGHDLCAVTADHELGGYLLAAHLIELGHRAIALLWPPQNVAGLQLRWQGAQRACMEAGLAVDDVLHLMRFETDANGDLMIEDLVSRVLDADRPPTAMMCFNDSAALRALQHLKRLSITVPGGISVTGYDDLSSSSLLSPALTTVRQPAREMGVVAAQLMLDEADPEHRHEERVLDVALMVRESTGPA